MSSNNRIPSPAMAGPNEDLVAQIQVVLECEKEPSVVLQPEAKLNGINRITNAVPSTARKPPLIDRFGTNFGTGQDFDKNESFAECEQLLAREMARLSDTSNAFEFDENPARHPEQVLQLHRRLGVEFHGKVGACSDWLSMLAEIGDRAQLSVADATNFERFAEATSDARKWASTNTSFLLSQDPDSFKPKTSPFVRNEFALISPQEQLKLVRQYWYEAFHTLSRAILRAVAQSVEVSAIDATERSLFGVIKYDELHRQATYNYLTREVAQEEQEEQKQSSKRRLFSTLHRTTTTKTVTEARQLVHHKHTLINVQPLAYQPALNAPWLQMPSAVTEAMLAAPAFLRPFLDVFAGDLVATQVVARDLETTQSVSTEHQDIVLPHDPALTLFRNFVLTGWNPADMQNELQRRSQVRVRQLRQTQIASEKELAAEQKAQELKELRWQKFWARLKVAAGLGAVALVVSALPAHGHTPLVALFLSALVFAPYLVHFAARHLDVAKRYRTAVRELDTEHVRLDAELNTLNSTPLSDL